MIWLTLLLGLLVILLITALTGYFVAQEFAYMGVDRTRLAVLAEQGDPAAQSALAVTKQTSFMLSGAQLGITVTGLVVGYVAEPLVGESIGTLLGSAGLGTAISLGIGAATALLVSTVVQMVFGELFPKNYSIANPEPVALRLAGSTTLYLKVFGPVIKVFDAASNALLRALKMEPVHDVEHSATARDLEHIVATSRESGDLPEEQALMLDRILDFPERAVEHAMMPRTRVDVFEAGTTLADARAVMADGHSRYPVLGPDDDIVGIVDLKDVLRGLDEPHRVVDDLARPALVLSHLSLLPAAVREMSKARVEMACVVDEYGGFAGILTLEDLAEEIVGEITDEHDDVVPEYVPVEGDRVWVMSGDVHLDEVERAIDAEIDSEEVETIAGLAIREHGGLPEVGDVVRVELEPDPADLVHDIAPPRLAIDIEVLEIERHVPSTVRVELVELPGDDLEDLLEPTAPEHLAEVEHREDPDVLPPAGSDVRTEEER